MPSIGQQKVKSSEPGFGSLRESFLDSQIISITRSWNAKTIDAMLENKQYALLFACVKYCAKFEVDSLKVFKKNHVSLILKAIESNVKNKNANDDLFSLLDELGFSRVNLVNLFKKEISKLASANIGSLIENGCSLLLYWASIDNPKSFSLENVKSIVNSGVLEDNNREDILVTLSKARPDLFEKFDVRERIGDWIKKGNWEQLVLWSRLSPNYFSEKDLIDILRKPKPVAGEVLHGVGNIPVVASQIIENVLKVWHKSGEGVAREIIENNLSSENLSAFNNAIMINPTIFGKKSFEYYPLMRVLFGSMEFANSPENVSFTDLKKSELYSFMKKNLTGPSSAMQKMLVNSSLNLKVFNNLDILMDKNVYNLDFEFLSRYPVQVLENMIDSYDRKTRTIHFDKNKPIAFVSFPKADWNGIFYNDPETILGMRESGFQVFAFETRFDYELVSVPRNLLKGSDRRINLLMISGHGAQTVIGLENRKNNDEVYRNALDVYDVDVLKKLDTILDKDNRTVLLNSCSTGKSAGWFFKNLAQTIADNVPNLRVFAPNKDTALHNITYEDKGTNDVRVSKVEFNNAKAMKFETKK